MQILILGMHRSGTSALARLVNLMGAYVGSEQALGGPALDNPKGFWERQDLRQLNDRLLAAAGATWGNIARFNLHRVSDTERQTLCAEAMAIVHKLDVQRPWTVKDPRLCLTLPFWRELLEVPVCLHIHRPPLEVTRSLQARDGFSLGFGLALWEVYSLHAFAASRGLPRLLVSYADLIDDPMAFVERLRQQLGELDVIGLHQPTDREIQAFVDRDLRHHQQQQNDEPEQILNAPQMTLMRAVADASVLDWDRFPVLSAGARDVLEAEQQYRAQLRDLRAREMEFKADHRSRVSLMQRGDRLRQNQTRRQASVGWHLQNVRQTLAPQRFRGFWLSRLIRRWAEGWWNRSPSALDSSPRLDLLLFPLSDWQPHARDWLRRMAIELAWLGHRVWYLNPTPWNGAPGAGYRIRAEPTPGLRVVDWSGPAPNDPAPESGEPHRALPTVGLEALLREQRIEQVVALLADPARRPLLELMPGCLRVDCYLDPQPDDAEAVARRLLEIEPTQDGADSDLTVVSTAHRAAQCAERKREALLLRRALDADPEPLPEPRRRSRPVVGYAGAGRWVIQDWILAAAEARPHWDFVVLDRQSNRPPARLPANLSWKSRIEPATLGQRIAAFDVCMLPWWHIPEALASYPVEVCEFLAAGKPIVASALPELQAHAGYLHIAGTLPGFLQGLDQAMDERFDPRLAERRRRCVADATWLRRALALESALLDRLPRVSVVLLAYNNLLFTRACLESLERCTRYPNWELIIVDNASSDGSGELLQAYQAHHAHTRLIRNERNLGFAAGNNQGLRAADGDYLVLLNNDTQVTEGWLYGLIRHLLADQTLGLIGPVTDNIGNEAKIPLSAADPAGRIAQARRYTAEHRGQRLTTDALGFFCVAFSRSVLDTVGLLDERFAVGYFEDDDYCRRVKSQGFGIAIAEDVFVQHRLSASFDQLGPERLVVFHRNRALFEEKWGTWRPHRQRPAPSDGSGEH